MRGGVSLHLGSGSAYELPIITVAMTRTAACLVHCVLVWFTKQHRVSILHLADLLARHVLFRSALTILAFCLLDDLTKCDEGILRATSHVCEVGRGTTRQIRDPGHHPRSHVFLAQIVCRLHS